MLKLYDKYPVYADELLLNIFYKKQIAKIIYLKNKYREPIIKRDGRTSLDIYITHTIYSVSSLFGTLQTCRWV